MQSNSLMQDASYPLALKVSEQNTTFCFYDMNRGKTDSEARKTIVLHTAYIWEAVHTLSVIRILKSLKLLFIRTRTYEFGLTISSGNMTM